MRYAWVFFLFLLAACGPTIDYEAEEAAVKEVIDAETRYAAAGDIDNWRATWVAGDEANILMADATGVYHYTDTAELGDDLA